MNGPVLASLIPVISYPASDFVSSAEASLRMMEVMSPAPAETLRPFVQSLAGQTIGEMEETYIRTFDLNPDASLDLGWHLYGETYERGRFLVQMRQMLAEAGVAESNELPDNLTHLLALLPLLPDEEADELAEKCRPAIEKIVSQLEEGDSPYFNVLSCVLQLLQTQPETQRI